MKKRGALIRKKDIPAISVCFIALIMLYYNDILTVSVKNSLYFCMDSIIPSVFPFLIITDIITQYGLYPKKSHIISGLFIGFICGFPSGAKFAHSLYKSGKISKEKAEYLNAISNNAGISFTYGFASSALGVNGLIMTAIQLVSVLFSAVVLRSVYGKDKGTYISSPLRSESRKTKKGVVSAVKSAVNTTAVICAFIIIFSGASDIICSYFKDEQVLRTVIKGFFEFSGGIKEASAISRKGLVYGSFVLCWSGLCVCFQIKSVIKNDLSIKPYILSHLTQSAVSGTLAFIYLSL